MYVKCSMPGTQAVLQEYCHSRCCRGSSVAVLLFFPCYSIIITFYYYRKHFPRVTETTFGDSVYWITLHMCPEVTPAQKYSEKHSRSCKECANAGSDCACLKFAQILPTCALKRLYRITFQGFPPPPSLPSIATSRRMENPCYSEPQVSVGLSEVCQSKNSGEPLTQSLLLTLPFQTL